MKNKKAAPHSRFNTARKISIFWTLFIGICAVGGAVTMLVDPSGGRMGMDTMLPYFNKLPFADVLFQDFVFSGVALLIVNGITNMISIYLIHSKSKYDALSGLMCGGILMLWIIVEFYIWGFSGLSVAYGIFAVCQITNAVIFIHTRVL